MSDTCLFCKIVRRDIPADVVLENDHVVAFRDIDPKAPTHILIVPREHLTSLEDASSATMLGELMLAAKSIARTEGIAVSGYRVVVNTGADGGQSVFHLHVHLLGGRSMAWPPG